MAWMPSRKLNSLSSGVVADGEHWSGFRPDRIKALAESALSA